MQKTIGIIGFGNMGSPIAQRIKSQYKTYVFDKDRNRTLGLSGLEVAKDNIDLIKAVDTVILAVKPQDFEEVLSEIKAFIKNKLIISIAAGITTKYIERRLGKIRIIRVMPNLPAKIKKGTTWLCKGKYASHNDLAFAQKLFTYLGKTFKIKENLMNAATAISGSGPGFLFYELRNRPKKEWRVYCSHYFIPELINAARQVGFSQRLASPSAIATVEGSLALLRQSKLTPQKLCAQVVSKKGTTEAGLKVLHKGGTLDEAVEAAVKRALELLKE